MQDTAFGYLFSRLLFVITGFFRDWYIGGTQWFLHRYINTLERMDQYFAVRVTLRHFFEPLYKDYSIIGRILGIIFRSLRVLIGGIFYSCVSLIALALLLAWLVVPAWLLVSGTRGLLHF